MALRPALFLDRDGVVIEEVGYLSDPEQIRLTPGAGHAIASVNQAGIPVVVITNQAGVARGYFSEEQVATVHARLDEMLARFGAKIERYYFCPHHPKHGIGPYAIECECRKPQPGMLLQAAQDLGLDLASSILVGDKACDIEAGQTAGCCTILVRTGYGREYEAQYQASDRRPPDQIRDTLADAIAWALPQLSQRTTG
jgi:D-glycero-D-manno-heptose 1,7-bisphosphate phosphatase